MYVITQYAVTQFFNKVSYYIYKKVNGILNYIISVSNCVESSEKGSVKLISLPDTH